MALGSDKDVRRFTMRATPNEGTTDILDGYNAPLRLSTVNYSSVPSTSNKVSYNSNGGAGGS